jgi:hypothetical protein
MENGTLHSVSDDVHSQFSDKKEKGILIGRIMHF